MINKSIRFTPIASIITALVGLMIIQGWIFNSSFFKLGLPGFYNFKFNTGLCFLFSAISLFILDKQNPKRYQRIVAYLLISVVLLISVLTLCQHIFKLNIGIDDLFISQYDSEGNFTSLRMYFSTSIFFIIFNTSLLLIRNAKFKIIIQDVVLSILVILTANFVIYIASIHYSNINLFLKTALNTSLLLIVLYLAMLYSKPLIQIKLSFWKKIAGYFILVLVVLGIIFFSLRQNNQKATLLSNKIEHSSEVVLRSQKLFNLSKELVSSSRRFIISGDVFFLEKYKNDIKNTRNYIADLDKFTESDSLLNSNIDSLNFLVEANIKIRDEVNEMRLLNGFNESVRTYEIEKGQMILEQLNLVIEKIEDVESQMLSNLKIDHKLTVIETSKVILLFQIIILLLLIVTFLSIYNNSIRIHTAGEEINSNRKFLENILENIPNMLFVKKAGDLRFTTFNKAGEDLLGVTKDELIGKNDYDLFPIEQAEHFISADKKVLAQNNAIDFPEEQISTKFGMKWLHTRKIPVKDDNGQALYMIGISEDITEKKHFNDNLQKATSEIFDLYNNAPCGYHSIDADGFIVAINNTELNWLGYNRNEVIGQMKFVDIISDESKSLFYSTFANFKETGVIVNQEFEMLRKDGTNFPVILSASAIFDKDGNFLRSRSTVLDFTELKGLNEQILKFNSELEAKVDLKTAKLKVSNEELERFAYVASHDLQEPLRMVSSFLNLLEKRIDEKLDETERKYLHFAVDGALRMKILIQNLLEYSRLGIQTESYKEIDCNSIIQNILNLFKFDIAEHEVVLEIDNLPIIKANESQIQQLFQNLIGNSLKYKGKEKLKIEVGCEDKIDFWKFHVKDNGLGIDPKFFDQIFIIFKRLHNSSEFEGTGVGLSICQKIVQGHGGEIWVESNLGQGSIFYFTIPKNLK